MSAIHPQEGAAPDQHCELRALLVGMKPHLGGTACTTDSAKSSFRLRTPGDVVDAVPYFVGFEPADSLVLIALHGERHRVGLTARVDLPPCDTVLDCARFFVGVLQREGADQALLVLYPPSGGTSHPSVRPLAVAMTEQLAEAGIELREAMCVYEGRWWSLSCSDPSCCPPEGTPMSAAPSACAAAMTVEGRVVLGSRAELEHTIDPVQGVLGAAMATALPRARAALSDRIASGLRAETIDESLELFRAEIRARMCPDGDPRGETMPGVDEAARLIAALDDVLLRDELLTYFDGEWGDATRRLFIQLVRLAVAPHQVAALTVLAWLCYLRGNGALAGIAVERAIAADPTYGLAQILDQALFNGVNPDTFRVAMRGSFLGRATRPSGVRRRSRSQRR